MRHAGIVAVLAGAMLAVAGCGGSETAAVGSVPASATLAPADALGFVTLNTDEGSAQWRQAEALLDLFPGARKAVVDEIGQALSDEGLTWEDDVAPALGPEVVVVMTAGGQPVVLTQPDDDAKLDALLAKGGDPPARGSVAGWAALAEGQATLDAYRAAVERGTLETVESFKAAMESLPKEALARAWVDATGLTDQLGQAFEAFGTQVDVGVDSLAAAVSAEEDGLFVSVGVRAPGGLGDTHYEPKLLDGVPADAVAALSFGGSQSAFDKLRGTANLDAVSEKLQSLVGISLESVFDALSGEGVLYVRPGDALPEVTLVLAAGNTSETLATVDTIARSAAEQSGGTVTAGTEDGIAVSRLALEGMVVTYGALDDDTVIVTLGEDAIADFKADGDKLVDSNAFTRASEQVGLEQLTTGFLYVDVDGLIPFVEGLAGEDAVPAEAREVLEALDSFILAASGDGETTRVSGFVRVNAR
jgi:hypothetical protein